MAGPCAAPCKEGGSLAVFHRTYWHKTPQFLPTTRPIRSMTSIFPAPCLIVASLLASLGHAAAGSEPQPDPATTLWYAQPATSWEQEALPIGNGRLGAMIFGGVGRERIALNEESVWSGSRTNWNREHASQNLPQIRELLLAGKNPEAEALVNQTFTCTGGGSKAGRAAHGVAIRNSVICGWCGPPRSRPFRSTSGRFP